MKISVGLHVHRKLVVGEIVKISLDDKDRMVTRLTRVQKYLGEGIGHVP